MIRAVVFDLDGVLLDTEFAALTRKRQVLERHGVVWTEELQASLSGRKFQAVLAEALPQERPEQIQAILDDYYGAGGSERKDYAPLMLPHATATLQELKQQGYRLALATYNYAPRIRRVLATCHWQGIFECVLGLEQVSRPKPDPEVYRKAMAQLGCGPDETAIVEDSTVGLAAAVGARPALVICRKEERFAVDQCGADRYIHDLAEIPAILSPASGRP